MRLPIFLASIALLAGTALANASIVTNKCDFNVWVTSVSKTPGITNKLAPNSSWSEGQYFDETGTAIKITRSEKGLWEGKPVLTFAYSYHKGEEIYYDLSSHAGFDFWGKKLVLGGEKDKDAEEIVWNGEPKPNHTAHYWGQTDLELKLCA